MPATEKVKPVKDFGQVTKPRAYSYVRFSTPDQMKGDSLDRQTRQATEYASAHGLDLDTSLTFRDLGISGYHGANAERGSLADFRFGVQKGDIAPGSWLLIENFDRLSRMDPWSVLPIFQEIINAGIIIVTLQDRKVWNREEMRSNPLRIMESIIVMMRAHEESAVKSARLLSVYERKRQRATNGELFTRRLPAWLEWDDDRKQLKVREGRGEIVRAIFAKAIEGWGLSKIARWLNDQHTPTWGDAQEWDKSYVKKILTNPVVIGTFTPHQQRPDNNGKRRRTPVGSIIENYFPAVVEQEMFDTVALRFATTAVRGRHANREVRSLFAGVLRCSRCGSTVSRAVKGEHVYLACAKAYSIGTHPFRTIRYPLVEKLFRQRATGIIKDAPRTSDEDLEEQIRQRRVSADALEVLGDELVQELLDHKSEAVRRKLHEAEVELEKARDELRTLIARRDALDPKRVERRLQALSAALKRRPFDVAAANAAMRQAIRKIVLDAEHGELAIYWQHAADDAEPQIVNIPMFTRVPGGWRVPTNPKGTKSIKTTITSPR